MAGIATSEVTLGGKPIYQPDKPASVNWFYSTTGAGRFGQGRVLMKRSDYDSVCTAAGTGTAALVIKDQRGGTGMTINVYVLSCVPYNWADVAAGDRLVVVMIVDKRYAEDASITLKFNCQKPGFTYTGSSPDFDDETLESGTTEFTWDQVFANMSFPTSPVTLPTTYKPRNLIFDGWQSHRVLDYLASLTHSVVGWSYEDDDFTLHDPGIPTAENTALISSADSAGLVIGGGGGNLNARRLPNKFKAIFNAINGDTPDSHFLQRQYTKDVTTSGTSVRTVPLHIGTHPATYAGGAFKDTATLDAVASSVANRAYSFISVSAETADYGAIIPFHPDGKIRSILWTFGPAPIGCQTKIFCGVQFDWPGAANGGLAGYADHGIVPPAPLVQWPSDQRILGVDGIGSSIDPAGLTRVWGGRMHRQSVLAAITGTELASGHYEGVISLGIITGQTGGSFDGATIDEECLIVNVSEINQVAVGSRDPSHWLGNNGAVVGVVVGRESASPYRLIVVTDNGQMPYDNIATLTGSGATADAATWDRRAVTDGTDYGDCGLETPYVARVVWDSATDRLLAYTRTKVYDRGGHLVNVTVETEVEVDTAEDCPE